MKRCGTTGRTLLDDQLDHRHAVHRDERLRQVVAGVRRNGCHGRQSGGRCSACDLEARRAVRACEALDFFRRAEAVHLVGGDGKVPMRRPCRTSSL